MNPTPKLLPALLTAIALLTGLDRGRGAVAPVQLANASSYPVPHPYAVAIADLNHDGIPDLVSANWQGAAYTSISVLLGRGDGTFLSATNFAFGHGGSAVRIADLNKDGNPDILTANYFSNTVSVLLGNGDGTFGQPTEFAVAPIPFDLALSDFNNDGCLDCAVASGYYNNAVTILWGDCHGGFTNPVAIPLPNSDPRSLVLADMNVDRHMDIVVGNFGAETISVLLGDGNGGFTLRTNLTVYTTPFSIATGDFDEDGFPDIVSANSNSTDWSRLLGDGTGAFRSYTNVSSFGTKNVAAVSDLNGDNHDDILLGYGSGGSGGSFATYLGVGDGRFVSSIAKSTVGSCYGLAVADLNGDGKPDVVAADNDGSALRVFLNTSLPQLQVEQIPEGIKIAWPNWPGYELESANDLNASAVWTTVTNVPQVYRNQKAIELAITNTAAFLRLRK